MALPLILSPQVMAKEKDKEAEPVALVKASAPTKRLVIKSFDPPQRRDRHSYLALGNEIGDMALTAMVTRGVDVMERAALVDLESEGELGLDGTVTSQSAAELGGKLGGEVMLVGRISQFGMQEDNKSLGGMKFLKGIAGNLGQNKSTARVVLDARLVEIKTGRILGAAMGEGTESKGSFRAGGGNLVGWAGSVNFQSSEWTDSLIGKATRKAVEDMANKLAPLMPLAGQPISSSTAGTMGDNPATKVLFDKASLGYRELQKMAVVVLIPETHLTRPQVPDPAAETEFNRAFLAAGLKVKDGKTIVNLRDDALVLEAARGNLSDVTLQALRTKTGADILVTGEAISERVEKEQMQRQSVFCRGRVEVKAIRLNNGDMLAAGAFHAPGRDLSESLASKAALQAAAVELAPRILQNMVARLEPASSQAKSGDGLATVELEISGLNSLKRGGALLEAMKGLAGVKSAEYKDWREGVLTATAEVESGKVKALAFQLETAAALEPFGLSVQSSNAESIKATAKGAPVAAPVAPAAATASAAPAPPAAPAPSASKAPARPAPVQNTGKAPAAKPAKPTTGAR